MAKKILVLFIFAFAFIHFHSINDALGSERDQFSIFDVRKNLPLKDGQKIYRDYYVNIGETNGVKVGSKLDVYRRVPLTDIYHNRAQDDLVVKVSQLKVIHVQKTMSVARAINSRLPANSPVVHFEAAMLGDRVQLAGTKAPNGDETVATNSTDVGE